jgi:hypothetical protein
MKKIFLIILSFNLVLLASCSKNDSPNENDNSSEIIKGLRVTINGITRIFTEVSVQQSVYEEGTANEYTSLLVRGKIETNSVEKISFSLIKGDTGFEAVYMLTYIDSSNRVFYYMRESNGGSFLINIISNDVGANLLKGKFSGTLQENGGGTIHTFTNGSFNVDY